jgi:hypothetical protein
MPPATIKRRRIRELQISSIFPDSRGLIWTLFFWWLQLKGFHAATIIFADAFGREYVICSVFRTCASRMEGLNRRWAINSEELGVAERSLPSRSWAREGLRVNNRPSC